MFAAGKATTPASPPVYVEEVFNTFAWTGTGGQAGPFVTGVDLVNKGGLLWTKQRTSGYSYDNYLMDTVRGNGSILTTNNTAIAVSSPACVNFYTDGFKDNFSYGGGIDVVSWTFREQAKFFDIVTYTGNGTAGRTVSHALGSAPGCIIVKATTGGTSNWCVYHRGLATPESKNLYLNATDAAGASNFWDNTAPTSSVFSLGSSDQVNGNGVTYIAYLFAHNAGGFGLAGTDSIISCGSYTGAYPSTIAVNLGWEPQWVLVKNATQASDFFIFDTIRGMSYASPDRSLATNVATAENATSGSAEFCDPTATGFTVDSGLTAANVSGNTHIYIAIRRGPMKVPTDATKVFAPIAYTGDSTARTITSGFTTDFAFIKSRAGGTGSAVVDRLRGASRYIQFEAQNPEGTDTGTINGYDLNTGIKIGTHSSVNGSGGFLAACFKRAPGFFDQVCYTGTGSGSYQGVSHNLKVTPELLIIKRRSPDVGDWPAGVLGSSTNAYLNGSDAFSASTLGVLPGGSIGQDTALQFVVTGNSTGSPGGGFMVSGHKYVAYLFATCPGVSKVGRYTGNGTSFNVDCGFTNGARFVLIKRTDSTGAWWIFDTARGINAAEDPYLQLNSTGAENNGFDMIDPYSAGFTAVQASVNTNGATYIFLAIA